MSTSSKDGCQSINTVALIGSYVPRKCGIATFTKDLSDAVAAEVGEREVLVLSLDDVGGGYDYPQDVRFQIRTHHRPDYGTAADLLNINQVDVTLLQHGYGIYGGHAGNYVLELLRHLRMPIITTLHTLMLEPNRDQLSVIRELATRSDQLVVMNAAGRKLLNDVYNVSPQKVAFIPHGIPDMPFLDSSFHKNQFGLEGKTVLLTFGLLSPDKGIEVALRALPAIVQRHPDVVYVVLGASHPQVLRKKGDFYRNQLKTLVGSLGVREHVAFHNRFVSLDELQGYMGRQTSASRRIGTRNRSPLACSLTPSALARRLSQRLSGTPGKYSAMDEADWCRSMTRPH